MSWASPLSCSRIPSASSRASTSPVPARIKRVTTLSFLSVSASADVTGWPAFASSCMLACPPSELAPPPNGNRSAINGVRFALQIPRGAWTEVAPSPPPPTPRTGGLQPLEGGDAQQLVDDVQQPGELLR